jgi:hypothetical protein
VDDLSRRGRLRSVLLGGIVGVSAGIAAASRRRPPRRRTPAGLAAFEQAPCYEETLERERAAHRP